MSAQPTGRLGLPQVAGQVVELEALLASARTDGEAFPQDMRSFGPGWGGDAQIFWRPPADTSRGAEASLALGIRTERSGSYELTLHHTKAPDYGTARVSLDGEPVGEIEGYDTSVTRHALSLGRHSLEAGMQALVVTVYTKDPRSSGYLVGLDQLVLRPVAAGPAPARSRLKLPSSPPRLPLKLALTPAALSQPRLEVYHEKTGFQGADLRLDWKQPLLRPRFRWHANAENVTAALFQFSKTPFPSNPGIHPQGLLTSGRSQLSGDARSGQFEIDLKPYAPPGRLKIPGKPSPPYDPGRLRPYVYVRAVALESTGKRVGQPSDPIKLFFGQPGKLKIPKFPPQIRFVGYRPPRAFTWDFQCRGVALQDIVLLGQKVVAKGQKGNLCKKESKSFLEQVGDVVGSVFDLVKDATSWAADAYNGIKAEALGAVVKGLKASGVGCGSECQFAVGTAMDAGLAATGMPPSLPEFDQLVAGLEQDGMDALAGQLAEAAKSQGVPGPLADEAGDQAVKELVSQAKHSAKSSGGGGGGIWKVDPQGLYSPAVVIVEARNPHSGRSSDPTYVKLDSVFSGHMGVFRFTGTNVPALGPGGSLLLSFELEPMSYEEGWMGFLPDPKECAKKGGLTGFLECHLKAREEAKAELDAWTALYTGNEHVFRLSTAAGEVKEVVAKLRCAGSAPHCTIE